MREASEVMYRVCTLNIAIDRMKETYYAVRLYPKSKHIIDRGCHINGFFFFILFYS